MRAASLLCPVAVVALAAGAGTVRADEPRVELGIRAGLNLASVHGDDVSIEGLSPENRVALSGGLFAGIRVAPGVLIQPEVLYTQKGARYEAAGEEAVIKLDYLEVPVLLKGRFGSGSARPSVFAGPAVASRSGQDLAIEKDGIRTVVDRRDRHMGSEPPGGRRHAEDHGRGAGAGEDLQQEQSQVQGPFHRLRLCGLSMRLS